jgi:hypothetical protein
LKLLILTFNYKPDLCAGSFRSTALVEYLQQKVTPENSIEVITTMPNRYKSLINPALPYEKRGNIIIHRIPVPAHNNGKFDQLFVFLAFAKGVFRLVKNQDYDVIYASSARLFTATLAAKIAKRKRIALCLDIRDIFTESIRDTSRIAKFLLLPILKLIEKYTIQSATHINLVSEGFRNTFNFYKGKTSFITNGIDDVFLEKNYEKSSTNDSKSPMIVTYAGNIGEGQGLEKIIPEVAKALEGKFVFNIIGDGGTKHKLAQKILDLQIDNVNLLPPINQPDLIKYYQESDYLFLHLNDYKAFEKVLPSKIFEYAATNKTIIAGVAGYAKDFILQNVENAITFNPNDVKKLIEILKTQQPLEMDRDTFIEKFSRKKTISLLGDSILALVSSKRV